MSAPLRLATRASALARWQAEEVARLLCAAHPGLDATLVVVSTDGDRRQDVPVWELGGQGVFVTDVQAAVLDGRADAAVHSAKDLPSVTAPGLLLACVPARADARDALVGRSLAELEPGAVVATGAVRRRAQLAGHRPDLRFAGLRGNIATRLERIPPGGAVVVAAAALERLGLLDRAAEILPVSLMLPQVGQGALAVECRNGDDATAGLLAAIEDRAARVAVDAERAFLARLGGGCDLPVGAHGRWVDHDTVHLEGMVATLDGRRVLRAARTAPAAEVAALGDGLAGDLLDDGAGALLAGDR